MLQKELAAVQIPCMAHKRKEYDLSTWGGRLAALMATKHWTYVQWGENTGISQDTMRRLRLMKSTSDLRPSTLQVIAKALNMTPEELVARTSTPGELGMMARAKFHDPRMKPSEEKAGWMRRMGKAPAGDASQYTLNVLGDPDVPGTLYPAPEEGPATLEVEGDSMTPLIDHGDIVVIATEFWRPPQSGDIIAAELVQENGHTIKRLEILPDGRWMLKAINHPKHDHRIIDPKVDLKASSVVVGWYHPIHRPGERHT